jgi:hypothetical protein
MVAQTAAPPDADGLRHLAARVNGQRVRAVIESMNGARFVHDTLEELGWDVLIADAQKVKGLAPLACKTDTIDARVLAELLTVGACVAATTLATEDAIGRASFITAANPAAGIRAEEEKAARARSRRLRPAGCAPRAASLVR